MFQGRTLHVSREKVVGVCAYCCWFVSAKLVCPQGGIVRWLSMSCDSGTLCLRFAQMGHDGAYFSRCEGLAVGVVAHLVELRPQLCAAVDPCHEVVDRRARLAVGEVHQRQFLLRIGSYFEFIHRHYEL